MILVFRQNGFHGTTLTKLTEQTGLEKASLYHYFPKGKNEMATVVLTSIIEDLSSKVLSLLKTDSPPRSKLKSMLFAIQDFYQGGTALCFLTIFSVGKPNEKISQLLAKALTTWINTLSHVLEELGTKQSKQQSVFVISTIQGSLILAHLKNDPLLFQNSLSLLAESWSITDFK